MEPRCKTPASSLVQAGLLLLLLLLRLEGCLGAGEAPGAQSMAVPRDSGAPCASGAPCPSRGPRLPRQAPATPLPTLPPTQNPASQVNVNTQFSCGMSQEQDPTLRDPESVARRWPWMVSVWANGTHVCAGTLIASQWVLTVAHCLIRRDVTYSVRVGSPQIDQMAQTTSDVPVRQVIVNSRFRPRRLWSWVGQANDIALLQLEWALKYSKYVWPICLPDMDYVVKDQSLCSVTGWGLPKVNGKWPQSRTIQEKEVTILNNRQCEAFYHKFSKIPSVIRIINSQMLCAEDTNREQFCYETSGEPLSCPVDNMWFLVGMVSWGPGCGKKEAPPIYLRVSSYKHWIWERMNGQALPVPSRVLLLALPLPLSLLAAR